MKNRQQFLRIALGAALTVCSSVAMAYPTDLQIRSVSGSSCNTALFDAEIKITNTSDGPINSSAVFPEFAFNAGESEIEAVYPQLYANIYAANGAFVTWTGASVGKSPWTVNSTFSSERRANQVWRVLFDPPRANPSNVIPPGGYLVVPVTFRRAGGATPFDVGCDDFSKVDGISTFHNDQFSHLIFTSTQQLVCEQLSATQNDPLSGLSFSAPFASACR